MVFSLVVKDLNKANIYKWDIGDKSIKKLFYGFTPNYMNEDEIIYVHPYTGPKCIRKYNFKTNKSTEVCKNLKKSEYWRSIYGIIYNSDNTINARMCDFTKYYFEGSSKYDLEGNFVSKVKREIKDTDVCAYSIYNEKIAAVCSTDNENMLNLCVRESCDAEKKIVFKGKLGDVAWRPQVKDTVAFAKENEVLIYNTKTEDVSVIARFPNPESSFVCRIAFSPNGNYLAAVTFNDKKEGDYLDIYVMDLTSIK